jgi:outer membrane protein assembly factor BamE (lipoprotein component of BamABCDE complex)
MNSKLWAVAAVGAGVLVGCSTSGTKVDRAQVETIRVGDPKESVQALIGVPDQVTKGTSGETWTYAYRRSSPNAKRFIPLLGTFIGGKNVETQTITVAFDQLGKVADVQMAYGGTDAKGRPVTGTTENVTSPANAQ